jgi:hypothetical protein
MTAYQILCDGCGQEVTAEQPANVLVGEDGDAVLIMHKLCPDGEHRDCRERTWSDFDAHLGLDVLRAASHHITAGWLEDLDPGSKFDGVTQCWCCGPLRIERTDGAWYARIGTMPPSGVPLQDQEQVLALLYGLGIQQQWRARAVSAQQHAEDSEGDER